MAMTTHSFLDYPATPQIVTTFVPTELGKMPPLVKVALRLVAETASGGFFLSTVAQALEDVRPPHITPGTTLHVIALNGVEEINLGALALRPPECMNMTTVNLMRSDTFLWFGHEDEHCVAISALAEWPVGPVLRMFISPTFAILVAADIGESLFEDIACNASCAGSNYNPYRVWTDAELEAAAQNAERQGISGYTYGFSDKQRHLVMCRFERSERTAQAPVLPNNFPSRAFLSTTAPVAGQATVRYRAGTDTYVWDDGKCNASARHKACCQIARAVAAKCEHRRTTHKDKTYSAILAEYFEFILSMQTVTRAEACWAIYRAGELLGWTLPTFIAEELARYNRS